MKFNFKHGAIAMGLAALLSACGGGKPTTDTEWFVCSDDEGEAYGFFNPGSGKMMYEDEFKFAPMSIVDGVFTVRDDDGYAVYSASDSKTPKVLGDLEGLQEVGGVGEGLLPVTRPNSRIEIYRVSASKAELAFTLDPVDGQEITSCYSKFFDGLLPVTREDGKMGVYDAKGKLVIDFDYSGFGMAHNGILLAAKVNDDDEATFYALDYKGEELFKYKKGLSPSSAYFYDNGYALAYNGDTERYVLINKKGETFNLSKDVKHVDQVVGDYMVFVNDGKSGVLRVKGDESEVLVRAKYRDLNLLPWDPTKFVCSKDGDEYELMDLDGNKLVDFGDDYASVVPFYTPNWKGFVGYESSRSVSECTCLDVKGEKIKFSGIHELYGLVVNSDNGSSISSDYFNLSEFVDKVSSAISADGLCGYDIGDYANRYFTSDMEPRQYTYTYWFTPKDEPDVKGYRYSSTIRLSAFHKIADWSYSYGSGSYYYFISDNPLDGMDLSISGPNDLWDKAGKQIQEAIESKGYTVKSEKSNSIEYYNPDRSATLTLSWSNWGTIGLKFYKVY